MAYEQSLISISAIAGADLSAKQYRFGTIAADGQIDPTGAGVLADGVIQDDQSTVGGAVKLAIVGVSKMEAGAVIARGALVMSDSVGRVVTATSAKQVCGKALKAAAAAGDYIPVLLKFSGEATLA